MSIFRSYFSKNNTITYSSTTNTGRNPITQLYFGSPNDTLGPVGYSRFIFDLDLTDLQSKISEGQVTQSTITSHILRMTNTSAFDTELLNSTTSEGSRRATSFDLVLYRIPTSTCTDAEMCSWDEGVGYDYNDTKLSKNSSSGSLSIDNLNSDRSYSDRPSNWPKKSTLYSWGNPGTYNNSGPLPVEIDRQHFELGNEDIAFDMTTEINTRLFNNSPGYFQIGYVVAYLPAYEQITGLTENYSVGFFTRHTQTFYQPFLETNYNDLITDNRNNFASNRTNYLYLYSYYNGDFKKLDSLPKVNILDPNGDPISGFTGLTTTAITTGVYAVTIPPITGYSTPCEFSDVWSGITVDGNRLSNITNTFILLPNSSAYQIGVDSKEPSLFGFDFYGIKQNEKILNTDKRKVGVIVKKAYSTQQILNDIKTYYRIYVREGTTEVQVQDWTQINRTPNEYYFIFDMVDKLPNEYYVDMKVESSGQVDTYKKQLTFQIVNRK